MVCPIVLGPCKQGFRPPAAAAFPIGRDHAVGRCIGEEKQLQVASARPRTPVAPERRTGGP